MNILNQSYSFRVNRGVSSESGVSIGKIELLPLRVERILMDLKE